MAENNNADVKKMPFERAIEELESIVKRLEEGKVPLEESVAIYERGEALKARCDELLRQGEGGVARIKLDANGRTNGSTPLDVDLKQHLTRISEPGAEYNSRLWNCPRQRFWCKSPA